MATPKTRAINGTPPRRRSWLSILLVAGLALGGAYWMWQDTIDGYAAAGTSFGAHSVCSCRYLGGRDMASCKGDFEPGMQAVFVSEDEEERAITAYVPLLSMQTARFKDGYGCVLDGWQG